ncbi:MAG TPA: hypothetical protein VGI38_10565 [Puia sp.]|jgi:hypothetical protein
MNIIETIQKNLGFEALKKIDPNTQETVGEDTAIGNSAVAQAGIPAVLVGIYNILEAKPDIDALQAGHGNLLENIFGKCTDEVVKQIEIYSKVKDKHIAQQLDHIATESLRVIKEGIGNNPDENKIRNFISKNKPDTLLYLPPSLDLGTILSNNNMDDRTGKMEGPVSTFMRNVEKAFNTSTSH